LVVGWFVLIVWFGWGGWFVNILAVMAVDPGAHGAVDRATVSLSRVDVWVPAANVSQIESGVWCGPSDAAGDVSAHGKRMIITFNDPLPSSNICKITASP
jgi:hypothetical protein